MLGLSEPPKFPELPEEPELELLFPEFPELELEEAFLLESVELLLLSLVVEVLLALSVFLSFLLLSFSSFLSLSSLLSFSFETSIFCSVWLPAFLLSLGFEAKVIPIANDSIINAITAITIFLFLIIIFLICFKFSPCFIFLHSFHYDVSILP